MAKKIVNLNVSEKMAADVMKIAKEAYENSVDYQMYANVQWKDGASFDIIECLKETKEEPNGSAFLFLIKEDGKAKKGKDRTLTATPWGKFDNVFQAMAALNSAMQLDNLHEWRKIVETKKAEKNATKEKAAKEKAERLAAEAKKKAAAAAEAAKVAAKEAKKKPAAKDDGKRKPVKAPETVNGHKVKGALEESRKKQKATANGTKKPVAA